MMSDYEIDDIRRIRHQVSADHDHDLRKVAEYYRSLEEELRESGRYRFADEQPHRSEAADTNSAI